MAKKSLQELMNVPQSEVDLAKIQAGISAPKTASIPIGDIEPPVLGDTILVKNVDDSGRTWPALVIAVTEEGAMTLEVHAFVNDTRRKLPNGQTVTHGVATPVVFIIQTDDTGNLAKPAAWFPRK
jgi:hypothetical protein